MEKYLVGGAVRDALLGLPVKERDWVVVGSTPEELLSQGFVPVGKDFPVFLHPKTKEEYALARTERKSGHGYKGFIFHASPDVTLEEDLIRRDLTINAMAQAEDGMIIDPFHGKEDLINRVLRHVSPAFKEDPLRVLRVARFAASYAEFNFSVHDETLALMKEMVKSGELNYLTKERVWKEFSKALIASKPSEFFKILRACHALPILFPEVELHPTILRLLDEASRRKDIAISYAVWLHQQSKVVIDNLRQSLAVPNEYHLLALNVKMLHEVYPKVKNLSPEQILAFLNACDCWRRPWQLKKVLACASIISKNEELMQLWLRYYEETKLISGAIFFEQGLKGEKIAEAVQQARLRCIANLSLC